MDKDKNAKELKIIIDNLNPINKELLLRIAIKILNGEINSFFDYQEFLEQ